MSSEEPLHVIIRLPYRRPPGFIEPTSIIWTEAMEQKLWEILTQNKRQSIDWNLASRLLNVPIPYLLRHAAFLYETQLRGVQAQLRRGEVLSASNSSGNLAAIGAGSNSPRASSRASLTKVPALDGNDLPTRTRASSRASFTKTSNLDISDPVNPPRASSRASLTKGSLSDTNEGNPRSSSSGSIREQSYILSRGNTGNTVMQDNARLGSFTSGQKVPIGSSSSSLNTPLGDSVYDPNLTYQGTSNKTPFNPLNSGLPSYVNSTSYSRRPISTASSVSTITPADQITSNLRPITTQNSYITTLSTIESESAATTSFETSASSLNALAQDLHNKLSYNEDEDTEADDPSRSLQLDDLSPDDENDEDYQESKSSIIEQSIAASFSDRLKKLQGVAAFLPLGVVGAIGSSENLHSNSPKKVSQSNIHVKNNFDIHRPRAPMVNSGKSPQPNVKSSPALDAAFSSSSTGKTPAAAVSETISGPNSMGSSFSDISEDSSVTRSALEDAIMSSNFGGSRMSMFSRKSSYFPG
ncbi:hypothetical protein G9A89_000132 [Geosiphon pyriformis]|nr:hypothetical protein G9A89_000132 [Geosiphon pyriformis]